MEKIKKIIKPIYVVLLVILTVISIFYIFISARAYVKFENVKQEIEIANNQPISTPIEIKKAYEQQGLEYPFTNSIDSSGDNNDNVEYVEPKIEDLVKNVRKKPFSLNDEKRKNEDLFSEDLKNTKVANLNIPSINLNLGIFQSNDLKDMEKGASTTKEGQILGQGNYILASHKSYTNELFYNIHSLNDGDKINISDGKNTYTYTVYANLKIKDNQTEFLQDLENQAILTLYTCEVASKTDNRVVIRAYLSDIQPNK